VTGVTFLLENLRANPNASCHCSHHKTALHYVAENGHFEVIRVLLKNGADPNALDAKRRKPIDMVKNDVMKNFIAFYSDRMKSDDSASFIPYIS